jgi:hypothetical protein
MPIIRVTVLNEVIWAADMTDRVISKKHEILIGKFGGKELDDKSKLNCKIMLIRS